MTKKSCGWRVFLALGLLLTLVGGLAIPTKLAASLSEAASVFLYPPPQTAAAGETVTVDIKIKNVSDLYGAEVHLAFDPALLKVVDADPIMDGVQIAPSTDFFPFAPGQYFIEPETGKKYYHAYSPDTGGYFVAQSEADNTAGTINYVIILLDAALSVSAGPEGKTLATLTFDLNLPERTGGLS